MYSCLATNKTNELKIVKLSEKNDRLLRCRPETNMREAPILCLPLLHSNANALSVISLDNKNDRTFSAMRGEYGIAWINKFKKGKWNDMPSLNEVIEGILEWHVA